jgi:hypothetical protein
MAVVQTSEVDRELAPVNVGNEILYADKFSKNCQLLIRPFFAKNEKYERGGGSVLKLVFSFTETTHESLHLGK